MFASWPNLLERLAILFPGSCVGAEDLPPRYRTGHGPSPASAGASQPLEFPKAGLDLREYLANIEQTMIRSALDEADGTVAQAARLLNLRRTTLVEKLRRYSLHGEVTTAETLPS